MNKSAMAGFFIAKIAILAGSLIFLYTVWSPSYLHNAFGLSRDMIYSFEQIFTPGIKLGTTLILVGTVAALGYNLKGGI